MVIRYIIQNGHFIGLTNIDVYFDFEPANFAVFNLLLINNYLFKATEKIQIFQFQSISKPEIIIKMPGIKIETGFSKEETLETLKNIPVSISIKRKLR